MRDIPEDPSDHQEPPHLGFVNPEASHIKGNTSLGFTRRSQKPNNYFKPGIEPDSFTTVGPAPTSPARSTRSPNLGPAQIPYNEHARAVTIMDQGPSLYATQTKPTILKKPQEEPAIQEPLPPAPNLDSNPVRTQAPVAMPATLLPSNREEMIAIPFSHRRQSALPKHINELAHTNTAMRDLIVTQRRRRTISDQVAQHNANGQPGDPYGDSSSSDDEGNPPPRGPPNPPPNPPSRPDRSQASNNSTANARQAQAFRGPAPPHFDTKFKTDTIPTWDGNKDNLADWITNINEIAERSDYT